MDGAGWDDCWEVPSAGDGAGRGVGVAAGDRPESRGSGVPTADPIWRPVPGASGSSWFPHATVNNNVAAKNAAGPIDRKPPVIFPTFLRSHLRGANRGTPERWSSEGPCEWGQSFSLPHASQGAKRRNPTRLCRLAPQRTGTETPRFSRYIRPNSSGCRRSGSKRNGKNPLLQRGQVRPTWRPRRRRGKRRRGEHKRATDMRNPLAVPGWRHSSQLPATLEVNLQGGARRPHPQVRGFSFPKAIPSSCDVGDYIVAGKAGASSP